MIWHEQRKERKLSEPHGALISVCQRVAKIQDVNMKRFQSDTCQEREKNAKNGELKFRAGGRNWRDRKARESLTVNMLNKT